MMPSADSRQWRVPGFLGIGAMRSGSTWLHANLSNHPGIWMPPLKEIHYFDVQRDGPAMNWCFRNHLRARARHYLKTTLTGRFNYRMVGWDLNYFLGKHDDAWYRSIFRPGPGQLAGEITPGYSIIDAGTIGEIAQLLPDLRLVFVMRNPIERAWSNAFHNLRQRQRRGSEYSDEQLMSMFDLEPVRGKGDYVTILNNWESAFGPERVFKGFMEDIVMSPERFLSSLWRFLGVDYRKDYFEEALLHRRIGTSGAPPMPPQIRAYLAEQYSELLEELSARLGSHATQWHMAALAAGRAPA